MLGLKVWRFVARARVDVAGLGFVDFHMWPFEAFGWLHFLGCTCRQGEQKTYLRNM